MSPLAGLYRSSSKRFLVSIWHGMAASERASSAFPCFHDFLTLFVFRIDEVDTPQFSSTVELWLLNCPFLLFLLFGCFRKANPNLRHQIVWSGGCLDLRQAPPGPFLGPYIKIYPERSFSCNNVNFANPVHESDNVPPPSTFQ